IQSNQRAEDALENAKAARSNLYAAHMNLAQAAWENGYVTRVRELLDPYRNPRPGQGDVRGWEWYYQERLCHDKLRTLNAVSSGTFSRATAHRNEVWPWWDTTGPVGRTHEPYLLEGYVHLVFSP